MSAPVLSTKAMRNVPATAQAERRRLEQMFASHHEAVWRTLRRRGLSPEAAADATQQCFLIAAERLADIRMGCERAFVLGTALRLASSVIRADRHWTLDDEMDLRPGPQRSDETGDRQRAVDLLDRVLSHMRPDLRGVFLLFEVEGLSSPEIAKTIGVPVGTVASRLRRAREEFRTAVARLERALRFEEARR